MPLLGKDKSIGSLTSKMFDYEYFMTLFPLPFVMCSSDALYHRSTSRRILANFPASAFRG